MKFRILLLLLCTTPLLPNLRSHAQVSFKPVDESFLRSEEAKPAEERSTNRSNANFFTPSHNDQGQNASANSGWVPATEQQLRVFHLRYTNATEAAKSIQQLFNHSFSFAVDERKNALIIRDSPKSMQEIEKLLQVLDTPSERRGSLDEMVDENSVPQLRDRLDALESELTLRQNEDDPAIEESSLELRKGVRSVFEARLELQAARLQALKQRVAQLERLLDAQRAFADQIVERRVEELNALAQTRRAENDLRNRWTGFQRNDDDQVKLVIKYRLGNTNPQLASELVEQIIKHSPKSRVGKDAKDNSLIVLADSAEHETIRGILQKLNQHSQASHATAAAEVAANLRLSSDGTQVSVEADSPVTLDLFEDAVREALAEQRGEGKSIRVEHIPDLDVVVLRGTKEEIEKVTSKVEAGVLKKVAEEWTGTDLERSNPLLNSSERTDTEQATPDSTATDPPRDTDSDFDSPYRNLGDPYKQPEKTDDDSSARTP